MSNLKDVLDTIANYDYSFQFQEMVNDLNEAISNEQNIVTQSYWKRKFNFIRCDNCGSQPILDILSDYCPWCGAKMLNANNNENLH